MLFFIARVLGYRMATQLAEKCLIDYRPSTSGGRCIFLTLQKTSDHYCIDDFPFKIGATDKASLVDQVDDCNIDSLDNLDDLELLDHMETIYDKIKILSYDSPDHGLGGCVLLRGVCDELIRRLYCAQQIPEYVILDQSLGMLFCAGSSVALPLVSSDTIDKLLSKSTS